MFRPLVLFAFAGAAVTGWYFATARSARMPVPAGSVAMATVADADPRSDASQVRFTPGRVAGEVRSGEIDATSTALSALEIELRAAARVGNADERWAALTKACLHWAELDPNGALALAHQLRLDDADRVVLADIVQRWADQNVAAAVAWANDLPADAERDNLLARLVVTLSRTQPCAAARMVVEQMSPGAMQDEAGVAVVHQWARQDYPAAQAWVDRFPAGELRERALAELAVVAHHPSS